MLVVVWYTCQSTDWLRSVFKALIQELSKIVLVVAATSLLSVTPAIYLHESVKLDTMIGNEDSSFNIHAIYLHKCVRLNNRIPLKLIRMQTAFVYSKQLFQPDEQRSRE